LRDVYVRTVDSDNGKSGEKTVNLSVTRNGPITEEEGLMLDYSLLDSQGTVIYSDSKTMDRENVNFRFNIKRIREWDIEDPYLYFLKLELVRNTTDAEKLDEKQVRFGFRTCEFRQDGFYLNHRRIKLLGLNRHQSYPYVGYAMPKRQQQRDAEILKKELKVNAVRTSHYPQSRHFLDRCDELGLLVFTEIPGWQHIGDSSWKDIAVNMVREMIVQYRNHPSIILWGVRINESQDDDEFYTRTNRLAHELDPDRQTGGVRYLQKSSLLEDVYTYNDFYHNGTNPGLSKKEKATSNMAAPYLVTEFNGHMFPTKTFDNEEHRLEHALRHARVLDALFAQEEITGGLAGVWRTIIHTRISEVATGSVITG
jgi:beta-galactosidase